MRTSLLAIAACLIATPALAEEGDNRSENGNDRDTIIVTGRAPEADLDFAPAIGSRLGLTNRETPAIVDVLTQNDFQVQGLNNAIDALNAAPGVFAGNDPGAIGLGSLRGFTRGTNWTCNGLVPVTCLSLCHAGLESQGTDTAQI